jgi:hypothetical protein
MVRALDMGVRGECTVLFVGTVGKMTLLCRSAIAGVEGARDAFATSRFGTCARLGRDLWKLSAGAPDPLWWQWARDCHM